MLSLGKLAPNQQLYYLSKVASGIEDYYGGAGESPGEWMGNGSQLLGLSGEVSGEDLAAVLAAAEPVSWTPLTRAQSPTRIPGFDATFRAPKSVSLLYALGDPETSNQVRNAHDASVTAALGYLEREAARARRGHGGLTQISAEGFVAAGFRHRTSRAGDPHLHTHVLIANVVRGADGRWSALDARPLYAQAKTAGTLYEAHLRAELTRRLGVEWTIPRNGIADVAGIPSEALRAFSRRRAEIEAHMAERGDHSARAAQAAALITRQAKDYGVSAETLVAEWRERAESLGLDHRSLHEVLDRAPQFQVPAPGTPEAEALFDHLAGPHGLTAHATSFDRRQVLQTICDALPAGSHVEDVEALADAFLVPERVVELDPAASLRRCDTIHRADGRVVTAAAGDRRFTTAELLETEARLLRSALARRDEGAGRVSQARVKAAAFDHPSLSTEQVAMVRALTRSGAGVEVVRGRAGTGKTTALAAARQAWESEGFAVIGAALAARAAAELQAGSAIPSTTLDRLLLDLGRPDAGGLPERAVVVLDEAAMIGTRKLAVLLDRAEAAGTKVVLVGDDRQLPEIGAGGAFAGLAERLGAIELTTNRRQHAEWERLALDQLRHGDPDAALSAYRDGGRIHADHSAPASRMTLVDAWWVARQVGESTLMIAARRADVDDLNHRARELLAAAGELGPSIVVGEREFALGEEVLATRNDRRLGVLNGTRGTVTALDVSSGSVTARIGLDLQIQLPHSYVEAGHLTYSYATTAHKAQGVTVDRTFVLGDDALYREAAYTAMSRGRRANQLFVTGDDDRIEDAHAPERHRQPAEVIAAALRRSGRQVLATDQALGPPSGATIDVLVAERRRLRAELGSSPADRSDELRRLDARDEVVRERLTAAVGDEARGLARLEGLRGLRGIGRGEERRRAQRELSRAQLQISTTQDDLNRRASHRTELRAHAVARQQWLADHAPGLARLAEIEQALKERRVTLGRWAEATRPAEVVDALGNPPTGSEARTKWRRAAGHLLAYQERWGHVPDIEHDPRRRASLDERRELEKVTLLIDDMRPRTRRVERGFGIEL